MAVGTLAIQKSSVIPPSSNFDDHVVSVVVFLEQHLFQLFISKMGDYRGEADESRWGRTGKIKFTSPSTLMMITMMMATLKPLWRPGSSNSNHSSAHSHFLSPHISPVNSPAIRWSLPSIVFCHCPHNCLIRASQRVPQENLALVAQPQVSNAIAAQLKSKKKSAVLSLSIFRGTTFIW